MLPVLAAYFAVLRHMPRTRVLALGSVVAVLATGVNLFPFEPAASTDVLVWIHLPVALWFVVGAAYTDGELGSAARWMDLLRLSGEWALYYALIALGGVVLLALTVLVLTPIAPDSVESVVTWVLPSGATGAVIVAAWRDLHPAVRGHAGGFGDRIRDRRRQP